MPISLIPIEDKGSWSGSTWVVNDEDDLAEKIAFVALGQSRSVERILHAMDAAPAGHPTGGFAGARGLLTVEDGADPYHRDGWVFQVISWIASHCKDDEALIRAPQMIKADKGLDGLIIEFEDDEIARVVICEEKATDNARTHIRDAVWVEFADFETGRRDNELVATVSAMLERSGDADPDKTIADILWHNTRAYRVAVTVGDTHSTDSGRKRLFKGYDEVVSGGVTRRRAETLHLKDVRNWISAIAAKSIAVIDALEDQVDV